MKNFTQNEREINLQELDHHPDSLAIYGEDEPLDSELMKSIVKNGLLHALVVDSKKVDGHYLIISGNRRLKALREASAAKQLASEEVRVNMVDFGDLEEEEKKDEVKKFIIESNLGRKKNWMQRTREGMSIQEVISNEAKRRQKKGVKENNPEGEKGETRDIIAKRVGLNNGKAFEHNRTILVQVDELESDNRLIEQQRLLELANLSRSSALNVIREDNYDLLQDSAVKSKKKVIEHYRENKDYLKMLERAAKGLIEAVRDVKLKEASIFEDVAGMQKRKLVTFCVDLISEEDLSDTTREAQQNEKEATAEV